MMLYDVVSRKGLAAVLILSPLVLLQGCVATRAWVSEELDPVNARISQLEQQLAQTERRFAPMDNRLTSAENTIAQVASKADQVDAKANQALAGISNLRFERRLEVDLQQGVLYSANSAMLTDEAKRNIDLFLGDLKGTVNGTEIFVVGGHADSTRPARYNYELARRRAESVAQYLTLEKKIDPMRVVTVSYAEGSPVADNRTRAGREKNRRVEIRVFSEIITTGAATTTARR